MIRFTVPGPLGSKGRPRFGRGRTYTDAKTKAAEKVIASYAMVARGSRPLMRRAVDLVIAQWVQYPPSWSKREREERRFVTSRPDADNAIKLVCDALNGVLWVDDAQVACIYLCRAYTDGPSETVITVEEL